MNPSPRKPIHSIPAPQTPPTKPSVLRPRIYLPFMVILCLMTMGIRMSAVVDSVATGQAFRLSSVTPAVAAPEGQTSEAPKTETGAAAPPATATKTDGAPQNTGATADKPASDEGTMSMDGLPPPEDDMIGGDKSGTEVALMHELTKRRTELAARSKALDAREALVAVAEKRVEDKIKEMETLRTQVQTLLGQANAAQQAQLDNLVKIYETMKPKEAARIFETMDLPILLGVVQKMKPARTAAVLAEMNPQKAKDITVALTKQDQLPQLK